jgi:tetratricopeptide (TPR) repeat protein
MVWRESIEVKYENAFKLQDIVSEKVLSGLKIQFSQDERERMQSDVPKDPLAYEYYLRAVSYPITLEGDQLGIEMLKKSIKLDSTYAPAYSELGFRIGHTANSAMLGIVEHRKAEKAFRKALSLNENLLTALWQLSLHYTEIGNSEEAAELINQMFRVTPNNAMAHYALGYLYRYAGMLEESVQEVEKALALDPKNQRFLSAGFTYVYLGNYKKAQEVFDLDRENTLSIAWKGMTLFLLGERERAIEYFDRAFAMEPEGYIGLRHAGVRAFIMGKSQEGLGLIRKLEEANPSDSDSEHWYLIGNVYSLLGERTGCIRGLRKAIEGGFFNYPGMLRDPLLDPFRDDSEFQKVLAMAKKKHETFKKKFFPEML